MNKPAGGQPRRESGSSGLRADPGDAPRRPRANPRAKTKRALPWPFRRRGGKGGGKTTKPDETRAKAPRRAHGPGRGMRVLATLLSLLVWAGVAGLGVVAYFAADLPDIEQAAGAQRRPAVTLVSADEEPIAAFGDVYGDPIRVQDLPPYVGQALMAIEDRRFLSHFGIDPIGILRAAAVNLRARRVVQGGSTITQQVAKNLFLTPDRNFKRKAQEVLLALWLEQKFTKQQILSLYLNRVYLGSGTFGVEAAAHRYFGVSAKQLSLYQAAMLAGLPKAPSRYNPANDPEAADQRTRQVLAAMVEAGVIAEAQAKAVQATAAKATAGGMVPTGRYFADWVMAQVPSFVGAIDRDLTVVTTLDRRLQVGAETMVENALAGPGAKVGASQGAVVVMSPDGAVRALVGGRDYGDSQFNRATQGLRQPGSAFKPLVFLAGLESGMGPGTMVEDAPISIGGWKPGNFTNKFEGAVSLRHALAHSINTVAVRVSERAGRHHVAQVAERLGLSMPAHPDASIALGTAEVNLLDLTATYAAFASGGFGALPYAIAEIRDRDGNVLYRRSGGGPGRVISPWHVGAMNRLMTSVIAEGTGKKAALDRPAAGKTGTTQDFRDAWFMGFTADFAAGVWVGNDDNGPMKGVTGGSLPAQLWRDVMTAAHRGLPPRPLPETTAVEPPDPQPPAPEVLEARPTQRPAPDRDEGILDGLLRQIFGR